MMRREEKELEIASLTLNTTQGNASELSVDDATHFYRMSSDWKGVIDVPRQMVLLLHQPDGGAVIQLATYTGQLQGGEMTSFAYPLKDSKLELETRGSGLYVLAISLQKLHGLFGSDFGRNRDEVSAMMGSSRMKEYFPSKPVSPEVSILFHQVFENSIGTTHQALFLQGKLLEIISYYMQQPGEKSELEQQCPFINDNVEMQKIRDAKALVVERLEDPLSLKDLARAVGTNEYKLKIGFKTLYGTTVYGYINDHRMQQARQLIEGGGTSVKEVAHRIGYSNPSHFIAAYKKKFGITPKRHQQGIR